MVCCIGCRELLRFECGLTAGLMRDLVVDLIEQDIAEGDPEKDLCKRVSRMYLITNSEVPDNLVDIPQLIDDLLRIKIVPKHGRWIYNSKLPFGYVGAYFTVNGGKQMLRLRYPPAT